MFKLFRKTTDPHSVLRYAADFVLVVLGVFLGLQAQSWATDRADRARAQQYIERIESDFAAILAELETCKRISAASVDSIEYVRSSIQARANARDESPPEQFAASLIVMTGGVMPPGRSAAYVEMISSGELRLLKNEELRAALIGYDQAAETNRDTWLLLREMLNPMMVVLYRHVALRKETYAQAEIGDYDIDGLASDPEIITALSAFMGAATNAYQLCESQETFAQTVAAKF